MLRIKDGCSSILQCILCSNEGFTSQIRNCVFTAYYCYLENKFLTIDDSRFVHGKWTDYFEPLYPKEVEENIKARIGQPPEQFALVPKYAFLQNYNYQQPLQGPYRLNGHSLFDDYKVIMNDMLRYSPETRQKIEALMQAFPIGRPYHALHIRRGDRDGGRCPANKNYVDHLMSIAPAVRNIFLMTDDYGVFEELQPQFAQRGMSLFTLCKPTMRGHSSSTFNSRQDKYLAIVELLTEIEIASRSFYFVGMGYSCVSWMIIEKHINPRCCHLLKYHSGVWLPDTILNNQAKVYILGGYFDRNI